MEMVVNGVSTRKVSHIVEELCGRQISQSKVSELGKGLSQKVNQFKNRPLGEYWDLRPLDNTHARHTQKKDTTHILRIFIYLAIWANTPSYWGYSFIRQEDPLH